MINHPRRIRERGFALLLVLIIVSLAAVIAIMFLLSARQERSGTSAYAHGTAVRELASQAVNIVLGQINAATHEGTMATPVSWASQPGMIRTYNTRGALSNAYKLYSWSNMAETGPTFKPNDASEMPDADWASKPAQYTDLNQPVNQIYPIVDPSVLDTAATGTSFTSNNPNGIPWDFPGEAGLITQGSGYYPSGSNKAPMPVQWLYILQDGTWSSPTNVDGNKVTVPNASATNPIVGRIAFWTDDETSKVNVNTASEGSFWDTPKAGTADELQFAGNPPLQNEFQRLSGHPATTSLSAIFPEFLGGTAGFSRWASDGSANGNFLSALQAIYGYGSAGSSTSHGLNPRLSWGSTLGKAGSQGGTFPITSRLSIYEPQTATYFSGGYSAPDSYAVTPNTDRLYATADDFLFQPTRENGAAFVNYNITAQKLSQRLFFLTADSVAPETTLYETPRVSMWPITWPYDKSSYWSSGDGWLRGGSRGTLTPSPSNLSSNFSTYHFMAYQENLLAFCSTLNANSSNSGTIYPYYFQRQDPDSPTWDWNNIPRNQSLVKYLTQELSDPNTANAYPNAPGIGASLGSKWDADGSGTTDWITLNCFDYIRSMLNQYTMDTSAANAGKVLYSYDAINFGTSAYYGEANSFTASPLRAKLNNNTYTTEGSYPALREAALVFYATGRTTPKFTKLGSPVTSTLLKDVLDPENWSNLISWDGTKGQSQTTQMRMVMLLNFSQMNPGITSYSSQNGVYQPVFWVKVSTPQGSNPFEVNGSSINFPLSGGNVVQFNPVSTFNPLIATSPEYAATLLVNGNPPTTKTFSNASSAGSSSVWSLISDPITISPTLNPFSFSFSGSKVQVDIYAIDPSGDITKDPTGNSNNLVSSQVLDFSTWDNTTSFGLGTGNFPLPIAPYWNVRQSPIMDGSGKPVTPVEEANEIATPENKAVQTVTGGVLMPYCLQASASSPNWQTEIVPLIGQYGGTTNMPWQQTRDGGSATLDAGDTGSEPLMYAYQDSTGTKFSSLIFENRVTQLPQPTSPILSEVIDNPSYGFTVQGTANNMFAGTESTMGLQGYQLITPYDTVISLIADPRPSAGKAAGDPRLIGRGIAGASATFSPVDQVCSSVTAPNNKPALTISPISALPNYGTPRGMLTAQAQYHELGSPGPFLQITGIRPPWQFGTGTTMAIRGAQTQVGNYPSTTPNGGSTGLLLGFNDMQAGLSIESNALMTLDPNGDWTRLPGNFADGGYLLRPDQEYQSAYPHLDRPDALSVPFFSSLAFHYNSGSDLNISSGFFSPTRQVASPVILGTLPDSMTTGWQTLNFCPNPAITMNSGAPHPGLGVTNSPSATDAPYSSAPDHLLLDLFWMPVAEPYPISEEFATAGKVNLNYAMMPFPYIQRKTALDALLKSVWITAMPSPSVSANFPVYYKSYGMLYQTGRLDLTHTRYPINVNATLKAFDYKFQQGDIFRTASQICDMFLYPNDPSTPNTLWGGDSRTQGIGGADAPPSTSNIVAWWKANSFTADNERESPYNAIYSRVTTKSNTYTVHWRAQTLMASAAHPTQWIEGTDPVASELRGSTLIERYIDPNAALPDYATNTPAKAGAQVQPMSYYYKWRVNSESYFQPSP